MTRLLMLELDPHLVAVVRRALVAERIEVLGVTTPEHALQHAERGGFEVALLDAELLDPARLDAFAAVACIVTSAWPATLGRLARERDLLLLPKPFGSAQLLSVLQTVLGGLCSERARVPKRVLLLDVLSRAHAARASLSLQVGAAELFVDHGELVHVELAGMRGESALARVLSESQPTFAPIVRRPVQRSIHRPFRTLLLDVLRRLEEGERAQAERTREGPPAPQRET